MYDEVMPMHQGRDLPQFTFRQIDLPEVESWEVNGQYYLVLKVQMIGKRNRKDIEALSDQLPSSKTNHPLLNPASRNKKPTSGIPRDGTSPQVHKENQHNAKPMAPIDSMEGHLQTKKI